MMFKRLALFCILMVVLLSACGTSQPAATSTAFQPEPTKIPATALPPTAVPPTAVPTQPPTPTTPATNTPEAVITPTAAAELTPAASLAPLQTQPVAATQQVATTPQVATMQPGLPNTTPNAILPTVPANIQTKVSDKDQMVQIFIPAGDFLMGTNDTDAQHSFDNGVAYPEVYMHTVHLEDYWIDKTEVTNAQWATCVAAGGCKEPWHNLSYTGKVYYGNPEYDNYPVIYIDWWMANEYCSWAGRRLPTEAEWEKAARGTDGRRYPWGSNTDFADKANFCDDSCPKEHKNPTFNDGFPETAPVGSYPAGASPYGVLDMSGNVWEWTATVPQEYPYVPNSGREDPEGYQHIWRGGPWSNGTWWFRASVRYRSVNKYWYNNLGFRCAAD